ncbi:response regulator [Streptomonospora nanhaiensis]|uniref:DNA-binding NarL/FixJ family response regulator n=1 Tax=Streptomonospora nanhaiensis TaxID=1323731 RepID=A0A853BPA8_9ACTN|nr:response regulator transcription factor [Streptomonospora nanhaiensis]MBV2361908.1 response regulator transcription factor [Streptomonospora nanhaiensis]MBX9388617.1 response regulator transcription factor [Streptomonospora nanhaiensis]NYI96272.1 DNA-binding NarL/FixJ family response regulator [Streptomonospora nanhaiensis]
MRIIIAEDSVLLRSGMVKLLEDAGVEVAAAVGDAEALLAAVEADPGVDLCLIDIRMPPTYAEEGIQAAIEIRRRRPGAAVLLLSQHVVSRYAADLLGGHSGGVGYLLKDRVADIDEFLVTLRRVADGGAAIDPEVVSQLLSRRNDSALDRLSPREGEVLAAMAEGLNNAGIAARLVITERAVEKHIRSIFTKLDLGQDDHDHRRVRAVLSYLRSDTFSPTP